MKPKTMILILLAVVCGLGASYMTSRWLSENKSSEEKVTVLVTKKRLDIGQRIKVPEDLFEPKEMQKDLPPKDAICDYKELKDRVLGARRGPGEWITNGELVDKELVPIDPPPGYRAIGVKVNSEMSASGWASLPMSRVDIIHNIRGSDAKNSGSQILLQNVLVLGIDDKTKREDGSKPMSGAVIVLALTPEDALKIDTARAMGSLNLMLRPNGDEKRLPNLKVTNEDVANNRGGQAIEDNPPEAPKQPSLNNPAVGVLPLDMMPKNAVIPPPEAPAEVWLRQQVIYPDHVITRWLKKDKFGSYVEGDGPANPDDEDAQPQAAPEPRPTPTPTPAPAPKSSSKAI